MTKCSCCGVVIEPGLFTPTQLAAVDALHAAYEAFRAAGETMRKAPVEKTAATVDRIVTLLSEIQKDATVPQQVAIREAVEKMLAAHQAVKPS